MADKPAIPTVPTKVSAFANDASYTTKKYVDDAVAGSGSAVTYTLSISNNVITLTGSDGSTSTVTLPVYSGGVTT